MRPPVPRCLFKRHLLAAPALTLQSELLFWNSNTHSHSEKARDDATHVCTRVSLVGSISVACCLLPILSPTAPCVVGHNDPLHPVHCCNLFVGYYFTTIQSVMYWWENLDEKSFRLPPPEFHRCVSLFAVVLNSSLTSLRVGAHRKSHREASQHVQLPTAVQL